MGAPIFRTLSSRGMAAVLIAQFLSALADNALLFAALALLKRGHYPAWTEPALQESFIAAYIVLAPFAGPLADAIPKGRAMLLANAGKLLGALAMTLGANAFVAYGVVGVGAAAYSPAKYGILSELVDPDRLVAANGWMEGSTIAAILIGAVAGGVLADWSVAGALWAVVACYGAALLANLAIPRLAPAHGFDGIALRGILRDFARAVRALFGSADARFSVAGTSLFWGAGATLRFLLVAWVPIALGIADNRMPAYLNGAVAGGIVLGAALAARFVTLARPERAMPAGVAIGVAVCLLAGTHGVAPAFALMGLVGAAGGFFVVPLNALLQEAGRESVGSGHAVAIQNLAENLLMLLMVGGYAAAVRIGVPVPMIAVAFGVALSASIAVVWLARIGSLRRRAAVAVARQGVPEGRP